MIDGLDRRMEGLDGFGGPHFRSCWVLLGVWFSMGLFAGIMFEGSNVLGLDPFCAESFIRRW